MESPPMLLSRAGRSTNNMHMVFQDKEKHSGIESKVARHMGKDKDKDEDVDLVAGADMEDIDRSFQKGTAMPEDVGGKSRKKK